MEFKVAAIVNSYNRQKPLYNCIQSILQQKNLLEIIVVDDGSNPPLKIEDPNIKLIRNPRNIGVSRSRNIGALASSDEATHLFFTDDDIILEPSCFEILCDEQLWSLPNVGIVGGSVPNMRDKEKISFVWKYNCHPLTIDNKGGIIDLSEFWVEEDKTWSADHVRGGNQLIRRDIFFELQGFNWIYGKGGFREETDFCLTVKQRGYTLWFKPTARALHFKEDYGGVREYGEREKWYDNIFRTKWSPLQYMGKHIDYPNHLISKVEKR